MSAMRLKVMHPREIVVETEVSKVTAEAVNGSFTLLPRHVDFVAALVPGILTYVSEGGAESFVALAGGTLLKCGAEVLVSTTGAVPGNNLADLRRTVEEQLAVLDEQERKAQTALARLEADFVRRLFELGRNVG